MLIHLNQLNSTGVVSASNRSRNSSPDFARILFSVYVFAVVVLPTGDVQGVNVKLILSLFLLLFIINKAYATGVAVVEQVLLIVVPSIVLLEILTASLYHYFDFSLSFGHGMYIISTTAGCWLISRFVPNRQSECIQFVRLVIISLVAVAALKVGIICFSFVRGLPVSVVMQSFSDVFGLQLMSGDVASIGGRIQFVSDTLVPISLFALLFKRKTLGYNGPVSTVLVLLLLLSALASYSRFFWFQTALALVLGLTSVRKDKINGIYILLIVFAGVYLFDWFTLLMSDRFSAAVAGVSDTERTSQVKELITFFWEAPVFGHGLGTYTTRSIRNSVTPYGYEVQLLALCGQIGLAGVFFLFALLLYYTRSVWHFGTGDHWYKICLICLTAVTVLGGLTNPYLLNSTASINYGMLMVLGRFKVEQVGNRT